MAVLPRLVFYALCSTCGIVRGDPDTTPLLGICNELAYPDGDPYGNSVAYVLSDLVTVTPNHDNYDYYTSSPYLTVTSFGHTTCNTALANSDSATCLEAAQAHVLNECPNGVGVQYTLSACRIRYEPYQFSD